VEWFIGGIELKAKTEAVLRFAKDDNKMQSKNKSKAKATAKAKAKAKCGGSSPFDYAQCQNDSFIDW
jgi:hypothetical protein